MSFFKTELKYNLCTIKLIYSKCIIQDLQHKSTELCNYHLVRFKDVSIIPLISLMPITPHSQLQPQATTNLLSVSVNLLFLDASYKWNHMICGLLCLASFTYLDFFFWKFIHVVACVSTFISFISHPWYPTGAQHIVGTQ